MPGSCLYRIDHGDCEVHYTSFVRQLFHIVKSNNKSRTDLVESLESQIFVFQVFVPPFREQSNFALLSL